MRRRDIHEILEEFAKAKGKPAKMEVLRLNNSPALQDVIRGSMDKPITWMLPEGTPPFTEAPAGSVPSNLQKQNKMFTYFVKGGKGTNFKQMKREQIFIGVLEGIHPLDAQIVISMINKKVPVKGLTRAIVNEVFPHLLQDNS